MMKFKYLIKDTAWEQGKVGDLHAEAHLRRQRALGSCVAVEATANPLFFECAGYAGLSSIPRRRRARPVAALAFTNPTANLYHRLVPGFEAPILAGLLSRARLRPITGANPKAKRVEPRFPDPSANPHLAFAATTLAGSPRDPEQDRAPQRRSTFQLLEVRLDELADINQVPTSLEYVIVVFL